MNEPQSAAEAVRLEHRLTKLESAVVANTSATELVALETKRLATHVEAQNGRVDKLEKFQAQQMAIIAAFGVVSPGVFGVIFWTLERMSR